ncbi:hypothetical protein BJ085DRAFT_41113 [Dimargaris cristalligena]|uniref:Uncharacterized protein n=1 Tax=Dimargaris cristalligena TaxID=215637 RepID=A0A4P9ZS12_9FUNG|nr:hypothetical protein BJ085DRAFT_41113 [Dimargaris cristalligena]|eukprot:RKP35250.1 hypothetical protein BJ085DRAFT_41113 [Dimargaris cristalligena]
MDSPHSRRNLLSLPYEVLSTIFVLARNPAFGRVAHLCRAVSLDPRNQAHWLLARNKGRPHRALRNALLWNFCSLELVTTLETRLIRHYQAKHTPATPLPSATNPAEASENEGEIELESETSEHESTRRGPAEPNQAGRRKRRHPDPDSGLIPPPHKRPRRYLGFSEAARLLHDDPILATQLREFYSTCRLSRHLFNFPETPEPALQYIISMLARGVSPNEPLGYPLIKSAQLNNTSMTQRLLENHADPNCNDNVAIKVAAGRGNHRIVRLLLEHESLPCSTALRYAVARKHMKIANLLMKYGAAPDTETVRILYRT